MDQELIHTGRRAAEAPSVRRRMPVGFRVATPQFTVPDVVKAAEYYRDVLGFEVAGYWDGSEASLRTEPPPVFGIVRRDAVQVFFSLADGSEARSGRAEGAYDVYFEVADVDALSAELIERGAQIIDGPEDRPYGQRELVVADCHGLVLAFAEPIEAPPNTRMDGTTGTMAEM